MEHLELDWTGLDDWTKLDKAMKSDRKKRTKSAVMETERRGGLHSIKTIIKHLLNGK